MKKKHLVIIGGVMYPDASATGICVQRYAELLIDDYVIDIVCIASDMKPHIVEYASGIRIHALSGGTIRLEAHSKGVIKKLIHFYGQIQIKTGILGNMQWFSNAALKKLKEIDSNHKIDVVFSVCSPLSAHCAALRYKRKESSVEWVAYTVDLYAIPERIRPFGYSLESLLKKERMILQKADVVLLSEEIYNNHSEFVTCLKNVEYLPYVIPDRSVVGQKKQIEKKRQIDCVFAGSFYRNLRNPEIMLDLFSKIESEYIKLHLYSTGCEDIVQKYVSKCSSVLAYGLVTYEEIQKVYHEAEILVNIGNTNSDFIPSKTFEYIATGKPIINFYYGKTPDNVLKRYPLAFNISNENIESDVHELERFIITNAGKTLSKREIEDLYPENSINYIKYIFKDKMG